MPATCFTAQSKKRDEQERERVERIRMQKENEQRTQQQLKPVSSSSDAPEVEADREREEQKRARRADIERRRRQDEVQNLVRLRKESLDAAPAGEENRSEQMRRQRQQVPLRSAQLLGDRTRLRLPCAL